MTVAETSAELSQGILENALYILWRHLQHYLRGPAAVRGEGKEKKRMIELTSTLIPSRARPQKRARPVQHEPES